jgi:hypothetical protein
MKKPENRIQSPGRLLLSLAILLLGSGLCSCTRDLFEEKETNSNIENFPNVSSSYDWDTFMLRYDEDGGTFFRINYAITSFGALVDYGDNLNGWQSGWDYLAPVKVRGRQFVALHNGKKEFAIREISGEGILGPESDRQNWQGNYETFIGFHVGDRGFIFGQDSYGDHHWFVQEVMKDGKLAANECDNGNWNNYYKSATPLYANGNTFLFFEEEGGYLAQTRDWFISSVSPDGRLTDVCDGYWACFWDRLTSVEIGGKTYLIGNRKDGNTGKGEWFINRIYENGTMGPETDRGWWNNYYKNFTAYVSKNKAYLFGGAGNGEANGLNYFFQEITTDGKMGTEISHGQLDRDYDFTCPFSLYLNPGSFRYQIGWDLSKTIGAPTRSWSPLFTDPWSGETKFGGGAALADIDGDINKRLDAVLVGIQSKIGNDRFYYKVAWNLDATGKAASWSQTIFGPACGEIQAGGGADIADIDGNRVPDLLLMSVDNPEGANSFRYFIGWNLGTNGEVASWSSMIQGPSIGHDNSGGGAALGDIDKNGRPDVVFMGIDNPAQDNSYWYVIGRNLDKYGKAESWTPCIVAPCDLGWSSAGGGASLADVNGNGKPDLVLTDIDSPQGANPFWCYIGWDIDINGNVAGWSSFTGPSLGNMTSGGGAAIADIDKNGILDLLLMTIDDPYGAD